MIITNQNMQMNTQPQQQAPAVPTVDPQFANTTFALVGFRAIEVPGTNPLHHKPMQIDASHQNMTDLQNATMGGLSIDAAAIRDIAKNIVKPSDHSLGQIMIEGSWDNTRSAIFMMFDTNINGRIYRDIFTGYTPETGISHGGHFDKNLPIFINSHMRVNVAQSAGNGGMVNGYSMGQNSQILAPVQVQTAHGTQAGQHGIRPTDMFTNLQRSMYAGGNNSFDMRGVVDPTTTLNSFRSNALSSNYLARLFTGYSAAHHSTESVGHDSKRYLLGAAASEIAEKDYSAIQLFSALNNRTSYGTDKWFTLGQLETFCQINWAEVSVASLPQGSIRTTVNDTQGWGDYSEETRLAHRMCHVLPAVFTDNMMATVQFSAAGQTGGEHIINIEGFTPMFETGMDVQLINKIRNLMQHAVLPELMNESCGYYTLSGSFAIGGTLEISIALDGKPAMPYSAPNYCDALGANTVTTSQEHALTQGQLVGQLLENTFVAVDPSHATQL